MTGDGKLITGPSPRFFITIDTEEDEWGVYRSSGFSAKNIKGLLSLQALFEKYGAIPTYLISYQVLQSQDARNLLLDIYSQGQCGIGTHCHPWNTPPFEEELTARNSMLSNLPFDLNVKKIRTLHETIGESFGTSPKCFRAGRWGFGPIVAKAIHNLGYQVDTSVTPFVDWNSVLGPDYRNAPLHIFRFNPEDVLTEVDEGTLHQVPVTIGFIQRNYLVAHQLYRFFSRSISARFHVLGVLERMRLLNFRWLSPELSNGKDMVALAKASLARGASHLNMPFHSTSLLPGKSPFVRTDADLERFLRDIERVLCFAKDERMIFSSLEEIVCPLG